MVSHVKKSLRRNKGRRVSQFKSGHSQLYKREPTEVALSVCNTASDHTALTSRITSFELTDVLSVTERNLGRSHTEESID